MSKIDHERKTNTHQKECPRCGDSYYVSIYNEKICNWCTEEIKSEERARAERALSRKFIGQSHENT